MVTEHIRGYACERISGYLFIVRFSVLFDVVGLDRCFR